MNEIHHLLTGGFKVEQQNLLYLAYPVIGVLLTVAIIKFLYKSNFDHGITNVLKAISTSNAIVKLRDTGYFMLCSIITVGSGGSVGLEATLVMGGSSIGSNFAHSLHLSYRSRMLLLGCGVAAALSAFFYAPVAGMIFALEMLMLDLTMASLVPLLMASITGILVSRLFLGENIMFALQFVESFSVGDIPFYILLGVFTAMVAVYFTKVDKFMEEQFEHIKSPFKKAIIGSLALGMIIFVFPPLYGEGYDAINAIINEESLSLMHNSLFYDFRNYESVFLLFIGCVILFKAFAVTFTLGSGGVGGYFAPSLFMGGLSGFFFARLLNFVAIPTDLSEPNFLLVGMSGVMSGLFHAPLTGIFLIAEITQSYSLIVPLMIVSTISYLVTIYFEPRSLFTRRLAMKGDLITHHKDKAVLTLLKVEPLIESDLKTVKPQEKLGNILRTSVAESKRNIFPVIDEENNLLGVILLDDIRKLLLKTEVHDKYTAKDLMRLPPESLDKDEPMDQVLSKFDDTGSWNLPVLDQDGKYLGFLSKSKIFASYRRLLVEFSEE